MSPREVMLVTLLCVAVAIGFVLMVGCGPRESCGDRGIEAIREHGGVIKVICKNGEIVQR